MSSQTLTIKLSRGENTPWGFRIQGGKDFSSPLVIQRVNPGSLAENAGLQSGDGVLKIQGQATENMRHKEAQDTIIKAGNFLEMLIQRGGMRIWRPTVTVGVDSSSPDVKPVTKTSLAATKQESLNIGSKHNVSAKPFITGEDGQMKTIVHNQYNSPANIYSMNNITDTLSAQTEILTTGAKGINFMKEQQPVNKDSAVYRMVHEEDIPVATESPTPASGTVKHVEVPKPKPQSEKPVEPSANQNLCAECGRLIVGVFVRIKDKNLHSECFNCSTCGNSLKNAGYFNINDKLYCDIHAKQAAKIIAPNLEAVPVAPGFSIPSDAPVIGVGHTPPAAPEVTSKPVLTTPLAPTTPTSYSNVSPIPFHPTKAPVPAPALAPATTQFTHPQTAPVVDAHHPTPGGAKFVWPPPKQPVQTYEPTIESNATPSIPSYRPPPGTQHVSHASAAFTKGKGATQFSAPQAPASTWKPPSASTVPPPTTPKSPGTQIQAPSWKTPTTPTSTQPPPTFSPKSPPIVAPKPHPPAQTSTLSGSPAWSSSPLGSILGGLPGSGSRPAPRRGRGQLKPQASPGTRIPICAVCGTPIRGPFVTALGKTWCPEHFHCSNAQCHRHLQDVGFVEEQGQLYCELCYEAYLAPACAKCGNRIKGDCLNALDKQWHPDCFVCNYCKQPFGNSSFYLEDGLPYCEKDWNELFTTKCVGCGYPIEAGDRWVEALNNNYHSQCFKCSICHKNLEGQSFYAKGGRPFCKAHAR
ncbi:PDZ and LIM domain protein Zasp-like isoform X7 [Limulus polyphemus]|uniref:PDZ and LIM domain protein Zasp-like isoform X7 n=1 Tax=Limulus polyphemus TaxID=6850 RepID=A0ABM1B427_LIMPO|nr:PDZ and LIM domain protein Zasp-like isoform X7 [Limulus polyphemus]